METDSLQHFFDCCLGNWEIERTYHYLNQHLNQQEVERSSTKFNVKPLTPALKTKVLQDNQYCWDSEDERLTGFQLAFYTISEKGDEVSQELNALFVPKRGDAGILQGDYLRDKAYEEARPIVSHFQFSANERELLMTTHYTSVVSVDSIKLINPNLRIRQILNYHRPQEGEPLEKLVLAGFGVEQKVLWGGFFYLISSCNRRHELQ